MLKSNTCLCLCFVLFLLNYFHIVSLHHSYVCITLFNDGKIVFNGPEAVIKMESSYEESHIFYLSNDEIKSRIIEEMQNYSFIYDKSDPLHCDRDKKIQVYETIGALLGLDCKYCHDTTRKTHVKYRICRASARLPAFLPTAWSRCT